MISTYDNNGEIKYSYDIMSNSEEAKKNKNQVYIDIDPQTLAFLRDKFSLRKEDKIFLTIIEKDSNISTIDYIYQYSLENGTILNLSSIEEDVFVDVYVPITDLEATKFDLIKEFAEQGYDIYDLNSDFYNDFCTPASLGGNDIALDDRKKDIYPHNVTLCKSNCRYSGINIEEQRVICSCNLNYDKNVDTENEMVEDDGNFVTYLLDNINYRLFLCYKLFFNGPNLRNSYPFYIILIIYIILSVFNFIFIFHSLEKIKLYLAREMFANEAQTIEVNTESKKLNDNQKLSLDNNNKRNYEKVKEREGSCQHLGKNEEKKEDITKSDDINELPFSKAIQIDNRSVCLIYYSIIIDKLELIGIIFKEHHLKVILLSEFISALLINFFFNALLYTDDVVSNKYHNNGQLDFAVTLALSILSNIVTSIFCYYAKYSKGIEERIELITEIRYKMIFYKNMRKLFKYLKIKFVCFAISQIIITFTCMYYIVIFGVKYPHSQESLVVNFCSSLLESVITSFGIALIILIIRKAGLSCHNKDLYNTSKYINSKF